MQTCSLTGAGADNDYIVLNRFDTLVEAYYTEGLRTGLTGLTLLPLFRVFCGKAGENNQRTI